MSAETRLISPAGQDAVVNGDRFDDESRRMRDCSKVTVVSACIVLGGVGIVLLLVMHPNTESVYEYGVVFDAGSSHSALYVYKWPGDKRLEGTAVPVDEVYSKRQEPGISDFVNNPSGAGQSLKGLIKDALKTVEPSKRSSTPLYFGATAGMRLVERVNKTISDQIMASVRNALSDSGFQFLNTSARIITGEEEGSCGWITANYLGKVLQTLQKPNLSLGALDLGGASTQITFVPTNASWVPTKHFRLYGQDFPVYTKTYLCYGTKEIYRIFLSELAKNSNYTAKVANPCSNVGYSERKNGTYLWASPCSCKPNSLPVSIGSSTFTFYGASNLSECQRQVARLFTRNTTCPNVSIFSRNEQPLLRGKFLAFSGYDFIVKNLNLSSTPTGVEFRTAFEKFCRKSWHEVTKYSKFHNDSRPCFNGHYVYALLTQGYGFNNQTWNISFEKSVDNKSLGWTLGYMINATNLIPKNKPKDVRLDDEILIPALVACAIFVLVGLSLCWKFIKQRKRRSGMHYNKI